MKNMRLWAQIPWQLLFTSVMVVAFGLFAANPASAQTTELVWKGWFTMHAGSFGISVGSVVPQCDESIGLIPGLTNVHCETLKAKANFDGECKVVMVEDGERYIGMRGRVNGNPKGESRLTPNMIKKTGRLDRALRCDLGDGIVVDWFTGHYINGKYVSCNNLGFLYLPPPPPVVVVPLAPPPVVIATPEPMPPPPTKNCRFVKTAKERLPSTFVHVNDFNSCGCYIPGVTVVVPGGIQTSSSLVCD